MPLSKRPVPLGPRSTPSIAGPTRFKPAATKPIVLKSAAVKPSQQPDDNGKKTAAHLPATTSVRVRPELDNLDTTLLEGEDAVIPLEMPDLYEGTGGAIVEQLDISIVRPHPLQPRTEFEEAALRSFGYDLRVKQIQPIFVSPIEGLLKWVEFVDAAHYDEARAIALRDAIENRGIRMVFRRGDLDGVKYIIIDGERRWRAGNIVGLQHLWGVVSTIVDPAQLFLISFFANEHREQLSEMDEARSFMRILKTKMMSRKELSKRLGKGKSVSLINQRLSLLKLPPAVQQMIGSHLSEDKRLGVFVAMQLGTIKDEALQIECAQEIVAKRMPSSTAVAFIRRKALERGLVVGLRHRKPHDDFRMLVRFLHHVFDHAGIYTAMSDPAMVELFINRPPEDLQAVRRLIACDIEHLQKLDTALDDVGQRLGVLSE